MILTIRTSSRPAILLLACAALFSAPGTSQLVPAPKNWTTAEDHRNMMEQLGIKALRPGPSGNEAAPNHANYDESAANPFPDYPEILRLKDGRRVNTPDAWWNERRPEIVEDFEREVLGRMADRIQNILWRLNNGELDHVNPRIVVLLAGTNNIGRAIPAGTEGAVVADITKGTQALVAAIQNKAPEATVIVTGIFPRNDSMAVLPVIRQINGNLAKMAAERKVRYLDINGKLADARGRLFDGMMTADKLHPAEKAYQVWADALKPIFRELLGPPGAEDHAPPPTGDPGAQR